MKKFEIEVVDDCYMSGIYNTIDDVAALISRTDAFKDIKFNIFLKQIKFLFDVSQFDRPLFITILNNYLLDITINSDSDLNIKVDITEARINDDEIKLNWTINIYYN